MAIATEDMPPDHDHLGSLLHRIKLVFSEHGRAETLWITIVPGVPFVLGRDSLKTESAKVSKCHAVVYVDVVDGKACAKIQNHASKSRTRLNDEELEVHELRNLSDQDTIRMGDVVGIYETQFPELPFANEEDHGSTRSSAAIREFDREAARLARLDKVVLILGAPGTGKESASKQIHEQSPRKGRPFVIVHCAVLTPALAVSALFGHRKGSFSGATADHKGSFEEADGGTIFLDEIGKLSLEVQGYLLRAIQDGYIQPVGDSKERKVNVRVVAATNVNLDTLVAKGLFLDDLRDRLGTPLQMPSLEQRRVDQLPLFYELWRHIHRASVRLTADAAEVLLNQVWDKNIRDLQDLIEGHSPSATLTGPKVREMLDARLPYAERMMRRAASHPPVMAPWTVEHAMAIFKMKPSLAFLEKISGKSRKFFRKLLAPHLGTDTESDD